jgi:hypothetical protein
MTDCHTDRKEEREGGGEGRVGWVGEGGGGREGEGIY